MIKHVTLYVDLWGLGTFAEWVLWIVLGTWLKCRLLGQGILDMFPMTSIEMRPLRLSCVSSIIKSSMSPCMSTCEVWPALKWGGMLTCEIWIEVPITGGGGILDLFSMTPIEVRPLRLFCVSSIIRSSLSPCMSTCVVWAHLQSELYRSFLVLD